jgi:hypothetical protein
MFVPRDSDGNWLVLRNLDILLGPFRPVLALYGTMRPDCWPTVLTWANPGLSRSVVVTSLEKWLAYSDALYKTSFAVIFSFCVTSWLQALGLFSRRAILGRSNKRTVVLEKIAKENSLNRTGSVNFNKYGKQDNIGFSSCIARNSWTTFCFTSTFPIISWLRRRPIQKLV